MIGDSDGDFAVLATTGLGGVVAVAGLVLAIVLYYVACENEKECAARTCPSGETARLLDHECVCTLKPIEAPR
jgi:hypothetical protein